MKLTDKFGPEAQVEKTHSTTVNGEKVQITNTFSFEGLSVKDVLDLALKDVIISRQRVLRNMSPERARKTNGEVVHASSAGSAPVDPKKLVAQLKAQGFTAEQITKFFEG